MLIVGDIHVEFGLLNTLLNKKQPDVLIQTGDNAYYWMGKHNKGSIRNHSTKVYLVPGNHEDWNMIESIIGRKGLSPVEVEPSIFICPIGSTIEVNGKIILFVGGAESIDKQSRIEHLTWFRQETLNYGDIEYIYNNVKKADIIISHTCPEEFEVDKYPMYGKANDPSRIALSYLLSRYNPDHWFFGHWHLYNKGRYKNTEWTCLNCIDSHGVGGRSWVEFNI